MNNSRRIGTIRTQVAQFSILDGEVARIIKDSLTENGFDLELKPVLQDGTNFPMGEEFKIFRIETQQPL